MRSIYILEPQFGRVVGILVVYIVVAIQIKSYTTQYTSNTVQLDASTIKKPYLYGPDELTKLAKLEHQIYHKIQEYIKETRAKVITLDRWKTDYKSTSFKAYIPGFIGGFDESDAKPEDIIVGHPLLTYRMIRRYTNDFWDIMQHFNSTASASASAFLKSMNDLEKSLRYGWPTTEDLNDSIDSILKIQDVYDLEGNDVALGDFAGVSTGVHLHLIHLIEIAKYASRTEKFVLALDWLQIAKRWNDKLKGESYKEKDKIIQAEIADLVEKHNKNWKTKSFTPGSEQMNYFDQKLPKNPPLAKRILTVKQFGLNLYKGNRTDASALLDYYAVCRGENFQPREELNRMKCWYDRTKSPELLVYPAKIEQLSLDPPIVKIYDAITKKAADALKQLSLTLQYVEIYKPTSNSKNQTLEYFKSRASANSWIPDSSGTSLRLLARRLESITGLNVVGDSASDHFEVVAYSCGGSFIIHKDALEEAKTEQRGDRISTVLFYLNNVTLGGRTAFPRVGTAMQPEAGTAVLWYNLFPNGDVDGRTAHAACPVILGHKWSVNKCPTEHGNFLKRKCPTPVTADKRGWHA